MGSMSMLITIRMIATMVPFVPCAWSCSIVPIVPIAPIVVPIVVVPIVVVPVVVVPVVVVPIVVPSFVACHNCLYGCRATAREIFV